MIVSLEEAILLDPIEALEIVRKRIQDEINSGEDFYINSKYSGSLCICGEFIVEGERITHIPLWNRWIHKKCADKERSQNKQVSKASILTDKIVKQAIQREAVYKPDLIELAKLSFLGKWGSDQWIADQIITTKILDMFGLHRLTTGYRFGSDKMMKKYAQKIEKEFAKRKGWICRRCHRLIWVEESVERGVGPICNKHIIRKEGDAKDV